MNLYAVNDSAMQRCYIAVVVNHASMQSLASNEDLESVF
jgi:hypothetical protein